MTITSKCPKCGRQLHGIRINATMIGIGCTNALCLFHSVVVHQEPRQKYFAPEVVVPYI